MTESDGFAALASPVRRRLLELLLEGPRSVGELAGHFEMSRPSVSEQLGVLRRAQLVSEHREGRQRIYRLEPAPLLEIQSWLRPYERFWRQKAGALERLLDAGEGAEDG